MTAPESESEPRYLNIGCGRDTISEPGWVNLDSRPGDGVDIVHRLGDPLPFPDNTFTGMYASHVLEHVDDLLPVLGELWRVAKGGCQLVVRVPHGASDNAWEDPTHVRALFPGSFIAWSQPYYWRTSGSYSYAGDWQVREVVLTVTPTVAAMFAAGRGDEAEMALEMGRNVVDEMVATLEAVKPARKPLRALMDRGRVLIRLPEGFSVADGNTEPSGGDVEDGGDGAVG